MGVVVYRVLVELGSRGVNVVVTYWCGCVCRRYRWWRK